MAAETAAKYSANPWNLYARELEFVAAYTGSIDAAEELLLQGLGKRWIRWTYWELDYGNHSFDPAQRERVRQTLVRAGCAEAKIETYLSETLRFFWQPAEHTRIAADRTNSSAMRTGPPWVVGSHFHLEAVDGKLVPSETCWPIYLPDLSPVTLKVKLVRLYHDNVVAVLRRAGLLPPQKEVTPQAPARLAARLDVGGTLVVVEAPDVAAFAGALTAPSTPDPSAASAPANVAEPIEPRAWYAKACKANPRRADESLAEHDQRIHRLMVKAAAAGTVTKLWKEETIGRQRRRRR